MAEPQSPAYFRRAVLYRDVELKELTELYTQGALEHRLHRVPSSPCRATLAAVEVDGGRITYGEVRGGLVNVAMCGAGEIVAGVVVHGQVSLSINGVRFGLVANEGIVALPGDVAVQVLHDTDTFTLRLRADADFMVRVKARPFLERRAVARRLARDEAVDLLRLMQFLSVEHDRLDPADRSAQVQALGRAIDARTAYALNQRLGPAPPSSPWMREICVACDRAIAGAPDRRHTAGSLAHEASCSVRHLYRAFETVLGIAPLEYQRRVRLLGVRGAIVQRAGSPTPLPPLARQFGFGSGAQLARAYAAEFGERPAETADSLSRALADLSGRSPDPGTG